MRLKIMLIIMLLSTLAIYAADAPLKLTAKADSNILFGEPIEYAKSSTESTHYKIAPVQVELTLTNTSDKPVTLNTYCSQYYLMTAAVTGPDISSVKTIQYLLEMAFSNQNQKISQNCSRVKARKCRYHFPECLML